MRGRRLEGRPRPRAARCPGFKEYVDATSLRQRIAGLRFEGEDLRESVSARTLRRHLTGSTLESTRRHGKHLFIEVGGDGWLRLHSGMTGDLRYYRGEGAPDHTMLRLDFPGGYHLAWIDVRKFGQIGSMRAVLREAIDARADPDRMPTSFLLPRREEGETCPRCGGTIERTEVVGRPTCVCPGHQS